MTRYNGSNHGQLDCLFNTLFMQTSMLWWPVHFPHKGPVMGKPFQTMASPCLWCFQWFMKNLKSTKMRYITLNIVMSPIHQCATWMVVMHYWCACWEWCYCSINSSVTHRCQVKQDHHWHERRQFGVKVLTSMIGYPYRDPCNDHQGAMAWSKNPVILKQ